jgi:hypothetical protein
MRGAFYIVTKNVAGAPATIPALLDPHRFESGHEPMQAEPRRLAPLRLEPRGGLMSLVMPHLSQIMLLNFAASVGLAVAFVIAVRSARRLRVPVDVLLVLMSGATLYAWNAMGQSNPYGTGTMALIVEVGLIMLAAADAAATLVSRSSPIPPRFSYHPPLDREVGPRGQRFGDL